MHASKPWQGLCQLNQTAAILQQLSRHERCHKYAETQWRQVLCLTCSGCQAGLQLEGFVVVGLRGAALVGAEEEAPERAENHAAALAASVLAQPAELPAIQLQKPS